MAAARRCVRRRRPPARRGCGAASVSPRPGRLPRRGRGRRAVPRLDRALRDPRRRRAAAGRGGAGRGLRRAGARLGGATERDRAGALRRRDAGAPPRRVRRAAPPAAGGRPCARRDAGRAAAARGPTRRRGALRRRRPQGEAPPARARSDLRRPDPAHAGGDRADGRHVARDREPRAAGGGGRRHDPARARAHDDQRPRRAAEPRLRPLRTLIAMPARDLRDWIALLEREGELVRVAVEVDPHLEVTEIVDRTVRAGGPALLFERPKGAQHPLLINQFGTERRMCLAFGVDALDDVAARLAELLELQPPEGLAAKVRGLKTLKSIADSRPRVVKRGASQDVVLRGEEIDLGKLPVQTCWPGDAAPFITLPAVITRDPRNGQRNVGMYRMQVLGPRATAMHWQIHKDGRADYLFSDSRMEIAVALGLDPVTAYSASAPLPKHIDELMFAGFLRGEAVELVKGVSVDLEVPANAEIVLEGYVEKGELTEEGPFGGHTGYYTPPEPFPVFHVTALTMRRGAIYPSIVVGKPPQEDAWLGKATERIFLPAIKATVPEIVDYDLPVAGAFHNCCIVSIRKAFPGHAQKVMHAIWGLGMLSLTKAVVVVDEWVDVHDYEEVFFRVGANVDPKRDVLISEGPLDHLDHAPTLQFYGGKLGIDATHKGPAEGAREWPPEIEMSEEIRRRVDERWAEYGIPLDGAARNGRISQSPRPLRRLLRR